MSLPDQREEAVFEAALQLPAEQRAAYLDQTCAGDVDLRRRLEALLGAFERAGGFMRQPATPERTERLSLPLTEKPGDRIGRYKLLQQIGEGGCGVVYMAEQEEPVRRRVALKVIKLGMDTKQVIARFEAERQALALMDHPNIAKIFDAGTMGQETGGRDQGSVEATPNLGPLTPDSRLLTPAQGRPYFVMELVRGIKITDFCNQKNLSTRERLDLFIQVCRAVQHAHQKGIIHRDIKPSNILVTSDDGVPVPKVIDFGIAKATQGRLTDHTVFTAFEQFIGTPAYMSPEQAEMNLHEVDTRTDIYSLGVLLYELLTGRPPFDQKELLAAGLDAMRRIIREVEPVKPSTRLTHELVAAEKVGRVAPRAPSLGESTSVVGAHGVTRPTSQPSTTCPGQPVGVNPQQLKDLIPALRGDLDWIVMKCLEKDRARRYETANGLAADLNRHLNDEPVVARPPSRIYEFQKTVKRHKFGFAAAGAVFLVLAGGLALTAWQARRAARAEHGQSRERVQAEKERQAAVESRRTLSVLDLREATKLVAEDRAADAAAYLARSVSLDPASNAALMRLATLLEYRTWMLPMVVMKLEGPVNSVEFNPDGTRFVTGLANGTARMWDARTGQALLEPLKHASNVTTALFSPNGERIITTGSGLARVWDAETGQPVAELKDKSGPAVPARRNQEANQPPLPPASSGVRSVEFSPSGKQLVTISEDNSIRLWDTQTGQPLTEPMKHPAAVTSAHFSPNGERIVTTSGGAACVWDAPTGQPVAETSTRTNLVSPDGKRRLSILLGHIVRVVDAQTAQPLTEPMRHDALVTRALFSPDGKRLVTVSLDNVVRVWDAQTGRPLLEPMKHTGAVASAQFSPDAERIVTASGDTARVWDARTAQPLLESMKHPSNVSSAQFSPDGKWIATTANDTVCVWDAQTGQPIAETLIHTNLLNSDGKRGLSIMLGRIVRVVDVETGQPLTEPMPHETEVYITVFSPDEKRLLTVSRENVVRVWDAQTGRPFTELMKHTSTVPSAQFSPDGKRIVTISGGTARVWNAQTGQPVTELKREGGTVVPVPPNPGANLPPLPPPIASDGVLSVQFSPDGKRLVTVARDRAVRVWDAQTGQPVTGPMTHTKQLASAQFTPDGQRIETFSRDNQVRVWDAQTGQLVSEYKKEGGPVAQALPDPNPHLPPVPTGSQSVVSVQFSPDAKRLVTVSRDSTVRVWEAQTGRLLTEPMKHTNSVAAAQFSADGERVEAFSTDNQVRVWDAHTGKPLPELAKEGQLAVTPRPTPGVSFRPLSTASGSNAVASAEFSPDGKQLVTISRSNSVVVWDAQTGRPLTKPLRHTNEVGWVWVGSASGMISTFTKDNLSWVWDPKTSERAQSYGWGHREAYLVYQKLFRAGTPRVISMSGPTVQMFETERAQSVAEPIPHDADVSLAELSSDGQRVVTVTKDNTLRVWEARTALPRPLMSPFPFVGNAVPDASPNSQPQFSHDGRRVLMPSGRNQARVWDALTGEPLRILSPTGNSDSEWDAKLGEPSRLFGIRDLSFLALWSPDNQRIITTAFYYTNHPSEYRIWNLQTGQARAVPLTVTNAVEALGFSPDGKRLLVILKTGIYRDTARTVQVWEAETGRPLTKGMAHASGVVAAQFSPDGQRLLAATMDGTLQEWEASSGEPRGAPVKLGNEINAYGRRIAEFSPDGRHIVTLTGTNASLAWTDKFRVWQVQTGQPLTEPMQIHYRNRDNPTFRNIINSIRFSPDGKRIVTIGHGTKTVYVWDAETGQPLTDRLMNVGHLYQSVYSASFSPDGRRLLVQMGEEAGIWELPPSQPPGPAWLVQLAEALSGRVLDKAGRVRPTTIHRLETLDRIRQKLATEPDDEWVIWGRWLLADRASRPISPFSKVTLPGVVNRLIRDNTLPSLKEATELAPASSAAWAGLAWRFKEQHPTLRNPGALDQAESYALRAIKLDSANSTAWQTLGAVHSRRGRAQEALDASERALQLQPTNALAWEVRGEILARTNRLAEALAAFERQVELQPAGTNQIDWNRRRAWLNRAEVLRSLARWDEARRQVSVACGIAPRDPQASTNLLDLSAFYNAGLKENWPADLRDSSSERYWREHSGYTNLPMGVQILAGTSFDVRGLILLHGEGPCTRRAPVQINGLPAPGKCRRVHFLHGTVRAEEPPAAEIAKYVFHFADGTTEQRPIVLGSDVDDWRWRPENSEPADEAKDAPAPAWLAPSRDESPARLYKTTWENPKPDVAITSIDFFSTSEGASPFLVAITVE